MINSRGWIVLLYCAAIMFGLWLGTVHGSWRVRASEADVSPYCQQVRDVVASIGVKEAEKAARAAGATDQMIADAKRCLRK